MKTIFDEETGMHYCAPDSVDDCLFSIWALGCDYDGYNKAEDLKVLIDDLVGLAQKARGFLKEGKLYDEELKRINLNAVDSFEFDKMCESCRCKVCANNMFNDVYHKNEDKACSPCDCCRTVMRKVIIEDVCPYFLGEGDD